MTPTNFSAAVRESMRVKTTKMAHLLVDNSSELREGETSDIPGPTLTVFLCLL